MSLVCRVLTIWYSLQSFNPFTPLGAVPISGHDYVEETPLVLRCRRCGHKDVGW